MKLFIILSAVVSVASVVSAAPLSVPPLPASSFADAETVTNLPLRTAAPGRDWHFDFQMSCATASNSVQIAFGVDEDADGTLAPEETRLIVGRDVACAFIEDPIRDERFEEHLDQTGPRVGLGARVSLHEAGRPSRFLATNETGRTVFADWRTNPPAMLFDPAWNLVRVTVRGPTVAAEQAFVTVGPEGQFLILR